MSKRHLLLAFVTLVITTLAFTLLAKPAEATTNWDKSSLSVSGQCLNGGGERFTVTNTGSGAMAGGTTWQLYVNGVLKESGSIPALPVGGTWSIDFNYGGHVEFRAYQRPGHPGIGYAKATGDCQGQEPTPTTVPPTATKVPPTATTVPPTATTVPPTATNKPPCEEDCKTTPPTATTVPPTSTTVRPTVVPPTTVPPTATNKPPCEEDCKTTVPPTSTTVPPTVVPPTTVPPTTPTATVKPPEKMDPEADVCRIEDTLPDGATYTLGHGPVAGAYKVDKFNPGKSPELVFDIKQLSEGDIVTAGGKDYKVLPSENPRIWRCVPIRLSNQPAVKDCNKVSAVRGSDAIYVSAACDPLVEVKIGDSIVYSNPNFGNQRIRVPAACNLPAEVWVDGKLLKSFKPTCSGKQ